MTPVHTSDAPVVVPFGESKEYITSHRSERLGLGLLGLLVVVLAVVMFRTSQNANDNLKHISDSGSTTYNMAITQHETLVFAFSFEQWLSGAITRRDLQIRRALLAQRLVVSDITGVTNGERIHPEYFVVLGVLDDYVKAGPPGFLPPDDRTVLRSKSADALKQFAFESREMMKRLSLEVGEQTRQYVRDEDTRSTNQYVAVLVILALMALVTGFLAVSRHRGHLMVRAQARNERRELDKIQEALQRAEVDLAKRLDKEGIERAEHEWLQTTVRSISSPFKNTIDPDDVAEILVESLGRTLDVDVVLFYSFPKFPMQRLWKQWHRRIDTKVEESLVLENESELFGLIEHLWNTKRCVIVNDSQLIDVAHDPLSKLATIAQLRARSWVLVPIGTGSQVLGCLGLGMFENARVWSAIEIKLVQNVVSEVADVFIQARLFTQAMQIAENDSEVKRLVELDKVKDDFIENMNHELRTPLTSIIGYMEMIVGDVDPGIDPVLASSLSAVQRNAIRLQSLIENMMHSSKTNFDDAPLVVSTVNIGHLLGDAVRSMELGAADSGIEVTLRTDSPAGDLLIDGDINRLEQVFVNLMSNAIKFTPRGGKVTIVARRAHTTSDYVEVKVTDTGIGIPSEEFPNVFKRFFRASTATQAAIPGFGIGLSLVQSIVHEHRGTITFDSTVGKGTVFTVTLPTRHISTKPANEII